MTYYVSRVVRWTQCADGVRIQAEGGEKKKKKKKKKKKAKGRKSTSEVACSVPSGGGAIVTTQHRRCRRPSSRAHLGRAPDCWAGEDGDGIQSSGSLQLTVFPENVMSTAPAKKLTNTHKAPENGTTAPKAPFFGAEGAVFRRRRHRSVSFSARHSQAGRPQRRWLELLEHVAGTQHFLSRATSSASVDESICIFPTNRTLRIALTGVRDSRWEASRVVSAVRPLGGALDMVWNPRP
eukprot:gene12065-biopygen21447